MKEHLKALYELQQIDIQIAAAKKSLAALDNGAALKQQISEVERRLTAAAEELRKSEAELLDNELKLKSIETKKESFEKKLYTGQVTNPKELESMEMEIEMLGRSRGKLDDYVLELYDTVERQQTAVKATDTTKGDLQSRLAECTAKFDKDSSALKIELERMTGERQKVLNKITDENLLQKYETIKARYKDTGLAKVEGGKCGGCHIGLTGYSIRKLKEGDNYEICESCGRILYSEE